LCKEVSLCLWDYTDYARVDSKRKREAIEAAYYKTAPDVEAVWHSNNSIRDFIADIRRIN
jgi:hypothetical protein